MYHVWHETRDFRRIKANIARELAIWDVLGWWKVYFKISFPRLRILLRFC